MNLTGNEDTRIPKDLPLVMQMGKPYSGVGRGIGRSSPLTSQELRPGVTGSAPVTPQTAARTNLPPPGFGIGRGASTTSSSGIQPPQTKTQPPPPPGYVPFRQALANANQPLREIEELDNLVKSYIPGLHIQGQNFPVLPEPQSKSVNRIEIPPELIREYRCGSKHPVSAMEEFSKKLKIEVIFKETALQNFGICSFGMFGITCFVEGKEYPQGSGKTKKEAKTAAARNAFDAILRDGFSIIKESEEVDLVEETSSVTSSVQVSSAAQLNNPQRNAASIFNEYCQKNNIVANISTSDKPLAHGFECVVSSQGKVLGRAYANNKKDAKTKACDEALRVLMGNISETSAASHFDVIATLVKKKLEQLQRQYPMVNISDYGILAGFVVKQFKNDEGRVVALATGNGCLKNLAAAANGKMVVDCHAEVLARRSLVKWFVKQLGEANDSIQRKVPNDSIFELNQNGDKFQLKESVSIHFYVSTAPCGDASAFPVETLSFITPEEQEMIYSGTHTPKFEREEHGCLRAKGAKGQISVKVLKIPTKQCSEESEFEVKFETMSCSDKILKWNVLGLQGSTASLLLEPVYINSVTIGRNFDLGNVTRALCCRVPDEITDELSPGFHLCHPLIGRVSVYEPTPSVAALDSSRCINWSASDQDVEIIDCGSGRSLPESPFHTAAEPDASRLCKFGFNVRFCVLAKALKRVDLLNHNSYSQLKSASTEYNAAKKALYGYMERSGFGVWLAGIHNLDGFRVR